MLRLINDQILTPEFVELLVSKVNENLARDTPDGLEAKVKKKQLQVTEVQRSIDILLDLAERFGAASAGARLIEREAELKQLQTELQELELRREEGRLETCPEQVRSVLKEMRDSLMGESIDDQRTMLAKILVGMEMGPTSASLSLSLPLSEVTGIYKMPPREFESLSPP